MKSNKTGGLNFKRNFISGLLTLIPLGITWLLLDFVFRQLSKMGKPLVRALYTDIRDDAPELAKLVIQPWFDDLLAVVLIVLAIYGLGWLTNRVVGRQILKAFEAVVDRLPIVKSVYGSVKKLINVLQTKPDSVERVVLIDFPHSRMKAIGVVTRTLVDEATGQELPAVYVPTTPNPTNGYLELVPVDELVSTDWTMDEAMNFVISGGAIARDKIALSNAQEKA